MSRQIPVIHVAKVPIIAFSGLITKKFSRVVKLLG